VCGECYTITEAHKYGYDITLRFVSVFNGKLHHFVPVITFSISYDKIDQNEFLKQYPTPDMLTCTADKLRWYRLTNGYLQKEIADMTGIHRSTYVHYENREHDLYDLNYLQSIADIYKINITCLLDDYMMFMYKGQGKQIKALRKSLGLTQDKLADLFNTQKSNIKHWEQERCIMQYDNFVKIKDFFDI
jgi:transcriptional regulator with XRE-family HTH domain